MDFRLRRTLNYAMEELQEIQQLNEEGKLEDKACFVRMFCLGKVLTGWSDEGSELEQFGRLMQANRKVMELRGRVEKMRAS